jgi:predicted outer membrane repeat protein
MEKSKILKTTIFGLVILLAARGISSADTHYVSPGQSIQDAINAASNSDQIQVAPGTYSEAINFNGKKVRLYSSGGADVTTINGTGHYHVVQCVNSEDANTILEGFTITGGNANGTEPNNRCGGGMFNYNSSPKVIGCVFHRNYTGNGSPGTGDGGDGGNGGDGAGMYNEHSSPTVNNCIFSENITGNGGNGANAEFHFFQDGKRGGNGGNGGTGGGIYNSYSSPTVTECTFNENVTGCGGSGGKGSNGSWDFWGGFIGGNGGNAGHGGYGAGICNFQSSPVLSDCKFIRNRTGNGGKGGKYGIGGAGIGGQADSGNSGNGGHGGSGAGISNNHSLPTVLRCIFNENWTGNGGGGGDGNKKENEYLTLLVTGFVNYTGSETGTGAGLAGGGYAGIGGNSGYGAGIFSFVSSATVTDCEFNRNVTGSGGFSINGTGVSGSGGGIYSYLSSPVITNCTFRGNTAWYGGGMLNSEGSPTVTNCTFKDNFAKKNGGGIYTDSNNLKAINCILWDDEPEEIAGIEPNVTYCDVQMTSGTYPGTGNINADPVFADDAGRLSNTSICINAGNSAEPNLPAKDFDGYPRIAGGIVDMGAFEYTDLRIRNVTKDISYGTIQAAIDDASDSDEICVLPGTYNEAINFSGKAVRLYSTSGPGSTCIDGTLAREALLEEFTDGNYNGWTIVTQGTVSPPASWSASTHEMVQSSNVYSNPVTDPKMLGTFAYWTGGLSWTDYEMTLTMKSDDDDAMGVMFRYQDQNNYYRFAWLRQNHGQPVGRMQLSRIQNGVCTVLHHVDSPYTTGVTYNIKISAIGSFVYVNDTMVLLDTDTTFASGSVALYCWGNQGTHFDNIRVMTRAYHVVQCASGEDANTILEGFTITGGNANGPDANSVCGAGMFNFNSSPTVTNCMFSGNNASDGGGMCNDQGSNPTVTDCTFNGNSGYIGGGMCNVSGSNPTVSDCIFLSNTASLHGGGMQNESSDPNVTNCIFSGNSASAHGGGIMNNNSSNPKVANCIFTLNTAGEGGGGMADSINSNPTATNCTFKMNTAGYGGGMYNYNSSPTMTNCILWGDTPDEIDNDSSTVTVTYSDVQGGFTGTGNIDKDPCFATGNMLYHPEYGLYLASSNSPCVDAGDSNAPGLAAIDLAGLPRIVDGNIDGNSVVDMGAYEFRPCVRNVTRGSWYQLIQASIMDAHEADIIVANPGTYDEWVSFDDNVPDLVLSSADPNDPNIIEQTIIKCPVRFASQSRSCVFEGFTVTDSVSQSSSSLTSPTIRNCVITGGSGIYFDNGSPLISGCTIRDNSIALRFGWSSPDCNAVVEDCIIANNYGHTDDWTRLVHIYGGKATFVRCTIAGNFGSGAVSCAGDAVFEDCVISDNAGGGVTLLPGGVGSGKMSRCTISNNRGVGIAGWSGPIENSTIIGNSWQAGVNDGGGLADCSGPITGCLIAGNRGDEYGGGLWGCSGPITNCVIAANETHFGGGGLSWCNGAISNCTIVGNRTWGIFYEELEGGKGGGLCECSALVTNCIIRQNWAAVDGNQLYSCSVPAYSCIQDWSDGGTGNISSDPCFISPGHWADINDINIILEPNEANAVWVESSYQIGWSSPCIDAGNNAAVPVGEINDISGRPRFKDSCRPDTGSGTPPIVDIGAYEFQAGAGIDGRGTANMTDFNLLAAQWMNTACGLCNGTDLTCDGNVDLYDLSELLDYWLVGI